MVFYMIGVRMAVKNDLASYDKRYFWIKRHSLIKNNNVLRKIIKYGQDPMNSQMQGLY